MPRYAPTIASTALASIHERGPEPLAELARQMVAAGMTKAKDPLRAVEAAISHDPRFLTDGCDRWYSLVDQLEGALFVVRPNAIERSIDVLLLGDELHLLARLTTPQRGLAAGGTVWQAWAHHALCLPEVDRELLYEFGPAAALEDLGKGVAEQLREWLADLGMADFGRSDVALLSFLEDMRYRLVLQGPSGWLPRLRPGQLLVIEVRAGLLEASALAPYEISERDVAHAAARVAAIARRTIGPDPSWFGPPAMRLSGLLETVAMEAPELLRRPLILADVLRRGGLELAGGYVGHLGTNWQEVAERAWLSREGAWAYEPPSAEAA